MGRNYTKGIIGAFIGGIIASIPWILLYIYGGMMSSYFAFIIGIGALKGYQYKGLTDRNIGKIITIVSLIIITLVTFIIIPLISLVQFDRASINNLITLYSFSPFASLIMRNYVVSVIFTLLGLRGVMNRLNAY